MTQPVLAGIGDSSFCQIPDAFASRSLLSSRDKICEVACGATVGVALISTGAGGSCLVEWGTSMYGERLELTPFHAKGLTKHARTQNARYDDASWEADTQRSPTLRQPVTISPTNLPPGIAVRLIACGAHFVVAAVVGGGCIAWGGNARKGRQRVLGQGRCGNCCTCSLPISKDGSVDNPTSLPQQPFLRNGNKPIWVTEPLAQGGTEVTALAAGEEHIVAICEDGIAWAWGRGNCGQLGIGPPTAHDNSDACDSCRPAMVRMPTSMCSSYGTASSNINGTIRGVACGRDHSAVLTRAGRLFTFGSGLYGQLGNGVVGERAWAPIPVDTLDGIGEMRSDGTFTGMTSVACGAWHTAAVSTTGDVYTWGWARFGALGPIPTDKPVGDGASEDHTKNILGKRPPSTFFEQEGAEVRPYPGLVGELESLLDEDDAVVSAGCGARYTVVLTRKQRAYVWGQISPCDRFDGDVRYSTEQGAMASSKTSFSRPCELEPMRLLRSDPLSKVAAAGSTSGCGAGISSASHKTTSNWLDAPGEQPRWSVSAVGCGPWYLVLGLEEQPPIESSTQRRTQHGEMGAIAAEEERAVGVGNSESIHKL